VPICQGSPCVLKSITVALLTGGAPPSSRTISTTAPLTGGGDLSANRTFAVSAASTSATGVVQLATPSSDTTAGHVVQASDARLSDARTPTGPAGGDVGGVYPSSLTIAGLAYSKLANGSATSVLGRSANSSGANASITCGSDGYYVGRHSSAVDCSQPAFSELSGTASIGQIPTGSTSSTVPLGNSTANGYAGAKYNPDRVPTSGLNASASDEFVGGINTGNITWGNQGTASRTAEMDSMRFDTAASASIDRKAMWWATPASTDFTITIKAAFAVNSVATNVTWLADSIFGTSMLEAGSIGSPTAMDHCVALSSGGGSITFGFYSSTSYTSAYTAVGSLVSYGSGQLAQLYTGGQFWLQETYINSTKAVTCRYSIDGYSWRPVGNSRTLSAAPVNIGIMEDQNSTNLAAAFRIFYLRTRTDVAATGYPFQIGQ
jgi:hypothetical protein